MIGFKAPVVLPPSASVARRPLPSTGSRRVRFPGFNGTMKRSDSLRTFTTDFLFVRPSLPLVCACLRRSAQARRRPDGLGLWVRPPRVPLGRWSRRASHVPGEPLCAYAVFSDPGGTRSTRLAVVGRGPRFIPQRGLTAGLAISRLNSTASALTVYASSAALPQRAQDSLPAACQALPGGIGYPQSSYGRFP